MKYKELLKLIIVLVLIVLISVFFACGIKIGIYRIKPLTSLVNKGLDLSGGIHAEFKVHDPSSELSLEDAVKNIMQKQYARIRAYGYKDIRVIRTSDDTISIDIPTAQDIDEIISIISQQGNLTFRYETGEVAIDGEHVVYAIAGRTSNNAPAVTFSLDDEGTKAFADITSTHINETLGIYLDDTELASPRISKTVTDGTVTITNVGTIDAAEKLAGLISSGKLDAEIELQSQTLISPVLSSGSFIKLLYALVVIFVSVMLLQIIEYRMAAFPLIIISLLNALFISVLILTANWTVFSIPVLYTCVCLHFVFVLLSMYVYDASAEIRNMFGLEIRKKTYKVILCISVFMVLVGLIAQLVSVTSIKSIGQVFVYEGISIILFILGLLPALMIVCTKMINKDESIFISHFRKKIDRNKQRHDKALFIAESILSIGAIAVMVFMGSFSNISINNLLYVALTIFAGLILSYCAIWLLEKGSFLSVVPFVLIVVAVACVDMAIYRDITVDALSIIFFNAMFLMLCLIIKKCSVSNWYYLVTGILLTNIAFVFLSNDLVFTVITNLCALIMLVLNLILSSV